MMYEYEIRFCNIQTEKAKSQEDAVAVLKWHSKRVPTCKDMGEAFAKQLDIKGK